MNNGVCNGCPDRKLHCHSTCKRHHKEKAEREAKKAEIQKKKNEEKAVGDVLFHDVADKAKTAIRFRVSKKKRY